MSWSADIRVDHADGYTSRFEIVDGHTYNLTPMWRESGAIPEDESTRWFDGKTCLELRERLDQAFVETQERRQDFISLNPSNGWGDFDGFVKILERFAKLAREHPRGVIEWSG